MAAPTVTAVSPTYGNAYGGDAVVITGTNFTGATAVLFGTTSIATGFVVDGATQITVASSPAHIPGIVNVRVTNADGTSAIASANEFEYVGLFSIAEARAFNNGKLNDASTYTRTAITEAEDRIRDQFTDICGVYFYPTSVSEYLDGTGRNSIMVSKNEVTAVTACICYSSDMTVSETFDATDITNLAIDEGGVIYRRQGGVFIYGHKNIYITYTCGYTSVPADIKRAALMVCLNELTFSNISDRSTSFSDGNMTFQLATAGRTNQWYGLPMVDSVLQRHNRTLPGLG